MQRLTLIIGLTWTTIVGAAALTDSALAIPRNPEKLRPSPPVNCGSFEDIIITGRYISGAEDGVVADGFCSVRIVDSYIDVEGVAVLVHGNGDVRVVNSFVSGGQGGLIVDGNGRIRYYDSEIRGGVRTSGFGTLVDGGGNQVQGAVLSRAPREDESVQTRGIAPLIGAEGIVVNRGGETVTIGAGGVTVAEGGEQKGQVRLGPAGVTIEEGGDLVRVGADSVQLESAGREVTVSGDWRVASNSPYTAEDTERLLIDLRAREEGGALRLDLAGDVLFDFDSTAIRSDAATELAKVAHVIREKAEGQIEVIGHTDSVGSDTYNQKLSERRAGAVMHWLNSREGIPASLMVGKGLGSKKPLAYNTMPDGSDNPEGRARNRRVEVRFATRN